MREEKGQRKGRGGGGRARRIYTHMLMEEKKKKKKHQDKQNKPPRERRDRMKVHKDKAHQLPPSPFEISNTHVPFDTIHHPYSSPFFFLVNHDSVPPHPPPSLNHEKGTNHMTKPQTR